MWVRENKMTPELALQQLQEWSHYELKWGRLLQFYEEDVFFFPQSVKFEVPAKHFSRNVEWAVGFKNLGRDLVCRYTLESLKNRDG